MDKKAVNQWIKTLWNNEFNCPQCSYTHAQLGEFKKHLFSNHSELLETIKTTSNTPICTNKRRNQRGKSDPIAVKCSCNSGAVLLFYNYVDINPDEEYAKILELSNNLGIFGKIRLATEGFNITVGGSNESIQKFKEYFMNSKLLPGIQYLDSTQLESFKNLYFKPSLGCKHVFENLSIKVVDELCPFDPTFRPSIHPHSLKISEIILGIQQEHNQIQFLQPRDFHQKVLESQSDPQSIILDVRNHYETQLGYFENAVLPPIRRFSSLPQYIKDRSDSIKSKTVLAYCTGGIRCEKASRFIHEQTNAPVYLLEGGIHNYLEWVDKNTSLYKGTNYVFDGRRVLGSNTGCTALCRRCESACADFTKCGASGCHLVIPSCPNCINSTIYCCDGCRVESKCSCEEQRRDKLKNDLKLE